MLPSSFDVQFNVKTKRVYRYGKAFVYVDGITYYFTFRPQQCIDRPYLRLKDVALSVDEVKRLPWSSVLNVARICVGYRSKKPLCVRVMFNVMGRDKFAFLARSTPRYLDRARAMESMSRETRLARDDEDQCVVCLSNVANAKFAPCGNTGVCCACAFKLIQTTKTCPLCRKGLRFFTRASVHDV